jgi:hypothetical protein
MAIGSAARKSYGRAAQTAQAADVKRTLSPEFLAAQETIEKRVREEGARRILRSVHKLLALGIVDNKGNRLKKELPADMQPGADRDFGG